MRVLRLAIERLRKRLGDLRDELQSIEACPITLEVARERLRLELEELALKGKPDLRLLTYTDESESKIVWPERILRLQTHTPYGAGPPGFASDLDFDSLSAFVYLHHVQLLAKLSEELVPLCAGSVDADTRRETAQRLLLAIEQCEREECAR
jgi:hypothetical protein